MVSSLESLNSTVHGTTAISRVVMKLELTILRGGHRLSGMRILIILCFLVFAVIPSPSSAQGPVFEIEKQHSWIKFHVKASTTIAGKFDKWDAGLTFTSADETTADLKITIQADSVDTGSGLKNGKLKGEDFFAVEQNPQITFVSKKIVKTGPNTYEVDGDFNIRGVSNPEKLKLTVSGRGSGAGEIKGTMVFNRKDYGMNKGIPFIKIADHVDVSFHLAGKRVSGPPLAIQ
jgi:polyisoprenoid-binding protein YceI